jgi:predicted nucleic acid-binding protein
LTFLLDTNVVSELRKPHPHQAVLSWFAGQRASNLFVPAIVLAELQRGVELRRLQDEAHAALLDAYVDEVATRFQVISMSGPTFRRWAKLMLRRPAEVANDAIIAATALERGLTVVTRNVRDFEALGMTVLNPFVDGR